MVYAYKSICRQLPEACHSLLDIVIHHILRIILYCEHVFALHFAVICFCVVCHHINPHIKKFPVPNITEGCSRWWYFTAAVIMKDC